MNRIKECRLNCNMSQKYVAMTLGVAGPSVSHWESGKTLPTPENLRRLASLFGVSVDYLLDDEKNSEQKEIQQTSIPGLPDETLIQLIADLSQVETQRVRDFVEGIKASRTD